jgi:cellulose synthase/poly-beta-1,6-N-acetylglucosamine synthase-like glycosyltransferase
MLFVFWLSLFIFLYTYLGYPLLLALFQQSPFKHKRNINVLPKVTVLIAAYNESYIIRDKLLNTLSLDYPVDLLRVVVVADGSTDNTSDIVKDFPDVIYLFEPVRSGKSAAINRAMKQIHTDIVVLTDANCFLSSNTLMEMVHCFGEETVGAVAGSKKVVAADADLSDGEGLYWKYESGLKKLESGFYSVIGAAGELVAFRRAYYKSVPKEAITDDFYISLSINLQGKRVIYAPDAKGVEKASLSLKDEWNRKVRIAAGGIQSLGFFAQALNPFMHPALAFQFISHRFFRWLLAAPALMAIFIANIFLVCTHTAVFYDVCMILQSAFYFCALLGYLFYNRDYASRLLQLPFYFVMMHAAQPVGAFRYFTGRQTAVWKKAQRTL